MKKQKQPKLSLIEYSYIYKYEQIHRKGGKTHR